MHPDMADSLLRSDHAPSVGSAASPTDAQHKEKLKRGYRACLHCRSRKAKCDLGDIDAPSSPPCSRCRRESRECVFAPSRRGGNNAKRKDLRDDDIDEEEEDERSSPHRLPSAALRNELGLHAVPSPNPDVSYPYPPPAGGAALGGQSNRAESSSLRNILHHSPAASMFRLPQATPGGSMNSGNSFNDRTPSQQDISPLAYQSRPSSQAGPASNIAHERAAGRTPSPKRRRLHLNPPLHAADPSSIVVADMQNESDALHILALASGQAGGRDRQGPNRTPQNTSRNTVNASSSRITEKRTSGAAPVLEDFPFIKLGLLSAADVEHLSEVFFKFHHHLFPMVPSALIPRSRAQLATFAQNEQYLLAAIVIIASRHDVGPRMRAIHDQAWAVMRGWLSDIQCLGAPATVGLIEALLLLAENLPRDPINPARAAPQGLRAVGYGEEVHGAENRQAWMLIGMAIRGAYGIGLDKEATKLYNEAERTVELERARLAWTYCYLFDRHVSLRLGKAFWSRGSAVCFQGFSSSDQTGPTAAPINFPYLRELKPGDEGVEHPQEDLASLVQAYVELTQLMSNAHDTLYPNAARTRALVLYAEYFKFLDEFARSLDGFKILWRRKRWTVFPLTDAVWAMFYYTQLYICAFSFQAHVERASMKADDEYRKMEQQHKATGSTDDLPRPPLSLFPRGAAASPDARYIFQACDAARALLRICVDSMYPGGALPYLPSRYLLWFTYAAIVLLKALYSGAMLRADHAATLELIDRLCLCFAQSSPDEEHPAVRYGRQLEALRKKLSSLHDATNQNSPTGGGTVALPPMNARPPLAQTAKASPAASTPAIVRELMNPNLPWVGPPATQAQQSPSQSLDAAQWTMPNVPGAQTFAFAYPTGPQYVPAQGNEGYVAPAHQQPPYDLTAVGMANAGVTNLGFATLDDWFSGGNSANANASEDTGALDLQDFWMKVGPGEAQGGFPFR